MRTPSATSSAMFSLVITPLTWPRRGWPLPSTTMAVAALRRHSLAMTSYTTASLRTIVKLRCTSATLSARCRNWSIAVIPAVRADNGSAVALHVARQFRTSDTGELSSPLAQDRCSCEGCLPSDRRNVPPPSNRQRYGMERKRFFHSRGRHSGWRR